MFRTTLAGFLTANRFSVDFLDCLKPVFLSGKRMHFYAYDLVDPNYIFRKRSKLDSMIMFDRGLVPFGQCGNGDYLVADARLDSATCRMVCILSHEYALEHADEIDRILSEILRPISNTVDSFCEEIRSSKCSLPIDYFEGNPNIFVPDYKKRRPKGMRRRTE